MSIVAWASSVECERSLKHAPTVHRYLAPASSSHNRIRPSVPGRSFPRTSVCTPSERARSTAGARSGAIYTHNHAMARANARHPPCLPALSPTRDPPAWQRATHPAFQVPHARNARGGNVPGAGVAFITTVGGQPCSYLFTSHFSCSYESTPWHCA